MSLEGFARDGTCPGCGVRLASPSGDFDDRFNASAACRDLYHDLCAYTLSLRDADFTHQLAVDAYAAQHAGPRVKPITITFALVGLYLVWERSFTGRQVQRVHTLLAATPKQWPDFEAPGDRAPLTVLDVVRRPDDQKPEAIRAWSHAIWTTWKGEEARIAELLQRHIGL